MFVVSRLDSNRFVQQQQHIELLLLDGLVIIFSDLQRGVDGSSPGTLALA
jgi:hypothetical protein